MISAHHPPLRLDKVLALETGLGLRRCRALIDRRLVLVDGRVLRKGDLVFSGQQISFMSETEAGPEPCWPRPAVSLVARDEHFAVLAKPGGLHTVAGRGPCLENVLPDFGLEGWRLVNRLDCLTSGLVLAARCAKDEAVYKEWQDRGAVHKWYLAVVHGSVETMILRGRILDAKRVVVRVVADEDIPVRWTWIYPVHGVGGGTLVLARIFKGRRHQIRAHLAQAGHPLVGDPVYGAGESGGLFLHHWRLCMPNFSAAMLPEWPCLDGGRLEGHWRQIAEPL